MFWSPRQVLRCSYRYVCLLTVCTVKGLPRSAKLYREHHFLFKSTNSFTFHCNLFSFRENANLLNSHVTLDSLIAPSFHFGTLQAIECIKAPNHFGEARISVLLLATRTVELSVIPEKHAMDKSVRKDIRYRLCHLIGLGCDGRTWSKYKNRDHPAVLRIRV